MSKEQLVLSRKYKAFLRCRASVEFLEGTTAAGKTTVGLFKFMLKVAESPKRLHILAAKDTGTAEKNIINKDLGILDDFGVLVQYNGNGSAEEKIPHILFQTSKGNKIIYVMGYGDKTKWKKALGGQYGCLYIDEINTADTEFIREAAMRSDYLMGTLNPDDPDLPVYKEYINCSRPLPEWEEDTPIEIRECLREEPKEGWVHWFFRFSDNAGLPEEKRLQILRNTPRGTKIWKNKIDGLRGRATGLVFSNFSERTHVRSKDWAAAFIYRRGEPQDEWFTDYTSGLDTAYSSLSPDTIAMTFYGITNRGKVILLDEKVYNNARLGTPIAPSDTVRNYVEFLERNRKDWGLARNVFIDSADQATIKEAAKYKQKHGCVYEFNGAWKKTPIIDRINMQLGWMACDDREPYYYVLQHCREYIHELNSYSWDETRDSTPEDGHDHLINSSQYAWLPYITKIGVTSK